MKYNIMAAKRFIAGAKCPVCKCQDTIYTQIKSNRKTFNCVYCGLIEDIQMNNNTINANKQPSEEYDAIRIVDS